ncbi:cyclopropane-fatty-acyl-phospholipid synthase [Candidatus Marimicrobium litorale]|uniref:Class I SAM-dependent methyltransferase n=1 Tax=Candidatus Marimicrobium litorale TaxID=2518991 RepID=A0ABT3T650_9GAMM|nr:cyclopropane-fatty-acyl-phospholipid synthase [Candidatus Marimicrobium litorale]MCX2976967.1 class I SAM-dependent methyltransferase [Candidatus Marimicrobium litorale]
MSNGRISSIGMPHTAPARVTDRIARETLFRLLGKVEIGSLTMHEGPQSYHFGQHDDPAHPHAEIHIHDAAVYAQVLSGGSLGAGEAYIKARWSSPDPVQVTRLFSANMVAMESLDSGQSRIALMLLKIGHWLKRNTQKGSRENITAHYDLGNKFFELFLDPTMMYSAALFADPAASLEAASVAKLEEICRQLSLKPDDHLLEIGTGWGGMAIHAAKHYGCKVTTTTISAEQYEYACEQVKEEGLEDRVTLLCEDYRHLTGQYDKLVSIEMIEAVGHQFYKDYFETCSRLLKDDGKMVLQAITIPDRRYEEARDSVDYIKRYIFPGGCLPSLSVMAEHVARDTDMQMVHLRDITEDYAITLARWRERFLLQTEAVEQMGFDQDFIRLWDYYLSYCEGGFRERIIGTVQLALAKPGFRF